MSHCLEPLEPKALEKIHSKAPGGGQVHVGDVHLFELVELYLNPVFNVVQSLYPAVEIVFVQHFGGLEYETAPPMLVNALFTEHSVVIGRVDPNDRNEIIEGPDHRPRFPVAAQDRENAWIENDIDPLLAKLAPCFRLSPEIDANRHAEFSEIGCKDPEHSVSRRDSKPVALQCSDAELALSARHPSGPAEKSSGIVALAALFFHYARYQITLKFACRRTHLPFAHEREIFRKTDQVKFLPPAFLQQLQGVSGIARIVEGRIRLGLNDSYSYVVFHRNPYDLEERGYISLRSHRPKYPACHRDEAPCYGWRGSGGRRGCVQQVNDFLRLLDDEIVEKFTVMT